MACLQNFECIYAHSSLSRSEKCHGFKTIILKTEMGEISSFQMTNDISTSVSELSTSTLCHSGDILIEAVLKAFIELSVS